MNPPIVNFEASKFGSTDAVQLRGVFLRPDKRRIPHAESKMKSFLERYRSASAA